MISIELTQNLLAQFAAGFQAGAIGWGIAHLSMFLVRKFQVQPAAPESLQASPTEQPLSPQPGEAALTVVIAAVPVALDQPAVASLAFRRSSHAECRANLEPKSQARSGSEQYFEKF
jgi:hypothetical protein